MSQAPGEQCGTAVLMVRPVNFRANPQTAGSNSFQADVASDASLAAAAAVEFDALADALRDAGVGVVVLPGRAVPDVPDQLFPNNWLSLHADGTVVLYPMAAPNRRLERRDDVLAHLASACAFRPRRLIDLTAYEAVDRHLEGTGSLVLDHRLRVAYACRSVRTDPEVAADFCRRMGYELHVFDAVDTGGRPVYHTNVMLSVGEGFAVACLQALPDRAQRDRLQASLGRGDRELLELTPRQMQCFAGNLLQLRGHDERPVIALSATALASLDGAQRALLARHGRLLPVSLSTIETAGGGSVRCMLAEVFLPRGAACSVGAAYGTA